MNHSVDRRRYCLIPSPVLQGRQEDDQEDQGGCDETCDDRVTLGNADSNTQTHRDLEPTSHALVKKSCATVTGAETRENVRLWRVGFCLHVGAGHQKGRNVRPRDQGTREGQG